MKFYTFVQMYIMDYGSGLYVIAEFPIDLKKIIPFNLLDCIFFNKECLMQLIIY